MNKISKLKKSQEISIITNMLEMGIESLSPDRFTDFEETIRILCTTRHIKESVVDEAMKYKSNP